MIGQDHYKIEFKKLIMGQTIYVCVYIYIYIYHNSRCIL